MGSSYTPQEATPNPYEAPSCQETDSPCERIVFLFFRFAGAGVVSTECRVLTLFPYADAVRMWLHHTRIAAQSPSR
jgi:hypothetical protein